MVATELITHHFQPNPHKPGPADAIVRDSGVSVWIIVDAYRASENDADCVAQTWTLPREELAEDRDEYLAENVCNRNKESVNCRGVLLC